MSREGSSATSYRSSRAPRSRRGTGPCVPITSSSSPPALSRLQAPDLIPELQGRFPIRVELEPLSRDDFVRILTEPQSALIKQYTALLRTEAVTLDFTADAVQAVAEIATRVNERTENIGARRLYTILERVLEDVSFQASDLAGKTVAVDAGFVHARLADVVRDDDMSRYIL